MKEKLIDWMKKSTETAHYLRLFVGCYIAYLGGSTLYEILFVNKDGNLLISLLSVLLVIAGVIIACISLYALIKHIAAPSKPYDDGSNQNK